MERKEAMHRLLHIKWLIERRATGSPSHMARNLKISERTLYRLLNDLKDIYRIDIRYSYHVNSYIILPASVKDNDADNNKISSH